MSVLQGFVAQPVRTRALRSPQAHPVRGVGAGRVAGGVRSCRVAPAPAVPSLLMKAKLAAVALLAVAGVGASVVGIAQQVSPGVAPEAVAGDPAWAHVVGRG